MSAFRITLCLLALTSVSLLVSTLEMRPLNILHGGFLALGYLLLSIAAFTLFVIGLSRARRRTLHLSLAFAASAALPFFAASGIDQCQKSSSIDRGDEIRHALRSYRQHLGGFPKQLDELAPQFLAQVPESRTGFLRTEPFAYSPSEDGFGFNLVFTTTLYWCTATEFVDWLCHD